MISLKTQNWQLDNIDTVIFDKDGTFIDLHYFWGKMTELRVEEIIKRYNLSQENFQKLCLKLGYDAERGKMLSDGITALYSRVIIIQIFCKDLKEFGIDISEKKLEEIFDYVNTIFYKEMTKYTKPIESAIDFIKSLRKLGLKIAVVTSDSKESTMLTLKHFNWVNLFDVVIGRESTKETKESGIPVKMALYEVDSNPETTVMIGDAPMDFIAAKNAGVNRTILAATGQIEKNELLKTSDFVVDSLKEVEIQNQD